jgi:iron complex outermembrane receptor protein
VPAQFYIANVGGAVSKGVELEIGARAAPGVDLFTSIGYTHARFAEGSISSGVNVEGNEIPNTPEYTASAGVQYSRAFGPATILGRADAVFYGSFQYNDQNSLGQEAYSLVNVRLAATGRDRGCPNGARGGAAPGPRDVARAGCRARHADRLGPQG